MGDRIATQNRKKKSRKIRARWRDNVEKTVRYQRMITAAFYGKAYIQKWIRSADSGDGDLFLHSMKSTSLSQSISSVFSYLLEHNVSN